jgi:hypothetical protein
MDCRIAFFAVAAAAAPGSDESFAGYFIVAVLGVWILIEASGHGIFSRFSEEKEARKDRSLQERRTVKSVAGTYKKDLDQPLTLIEAGTMQITSLTVDEKYVYLSSGSNDILKVYDKTGRLRASKNYVGGGRNTLCNDEKTLYTLTSDKKVLFLNKSDLEPAGELSDNRITEPLGVDGRYIYTGFQGYKIGVFDITSKAFVRTVGHHVSDIIAVCSDGLNIYSADSSFLQVTNKEGDIIANTPAGGVVCSLALDEKCAYISLYDGRIRVVDKLSGASIREIAAGHGGLSAIAVDELNVYYGSVKSGIRVFPKSNPKT